MLCMGWCMPIEPVSKRTHAFVDGQNLYHAVRRAFGYSYPNYDVLALATAVCRANGWELRSVHFYTGIPQAGEDPFWHHFWVAKLAVMGTRNVKTFSRPLRYHDEEAALPGGGTVTVRVGQEKGVDIRMALDIVRMAREGLFDVGLVFSQDQDLSEVADEVRSISIHEDRWIKLASAFPDGPSYRNRRGINGTDWIRIGQAMYDGCIDPRDYRLKQKP